MISLLRAFIKKSGGDFDVSEAHNGQEAVAAYKNQMFDLIFMDTRMPVMDGITALAQIKKIDASVKVFLCSSFNDKESHARYKDLGFDGIIIKPYVLKEIREALGVLIH